MIDPLAEHLIRSLSQLMTIFLDLQGIQCWSQTSMMYAGTVFLIRFTKYSEILRACPEFDNIP